MLGQLRIILLVGDPPGLYNVLENERLASGERQMKITVTVLLGALILACGCSTTPLLAAKGYDVVRPQFADVPVPEGFRYLKEKSYRFEYDWKNVRHGRLIYRGDIPADEVQDYYRENMVSVNWEEVSLVGGEKTTITFEKGSGNTKERCVVVIYALEEKTIVDIRLDPVK